MVNWVVVDVCDHTFNIRWIKKVFSSKSFLKQAAGSSSGFVDIAGMRK